MILLTRFAEGMDKGAHLHRIIYLSTEGLGWFAERNDAMWRLAVAFDTVCRPALGMLSMAYAGQWRLVIKLRGMAYT
jgi:hypothetical protein